MIKTERLRLYPATREQMETIIASEKDEDLKKAYSEMLDGCLRYPDQWEWYAMWMIEKKDGTQVGDFCFKGLDENGAAEIGYGILEEYQRQGYATEAIQAACRWAFEHEEVKLLEAETDASNVASQRVLEKCGFRPNGTLGEEGPRFTLKPGIFTVNKTVYRIVRLLGKGKGGYSYLTEKDGQHQVVKQIHHEPCDYYSFGNKIEAELRDYERLQKAGIRIPRMHDVDIEAERIVKDYIEGPTVMELVQAGVSVKPYLSQVRDMAAKAMAAGLNIDYYPTNFIVQAGLLWYVDYECNDYSEQWDFEHWGIQYWLPKASFCRYREEDYEAVCDFLIRLNQKDKAHINWNWARFEWMMEHPEFDKSSRSSIGLWWSEGKVVGAAIYDMYFGEAFCAALPEYEELYPEILDYAYQELKDDSGIGIAILDGNETETEAVKAADFIREEQYETVLKLNLNRLITFELPKGFSISELDPVREAYDFQWLLWQGFDHGEDRETFEREDPVIPRSRRHFDKRLSLTATAPDGDQVAYCCVWFHKDTDYAYVEPVCTVPTWRGRGIAAALLSEALNRAKALGAIEAYVISDLSFYEKLGFEKAKYYSFYRKV